MVPIIAQAFEGMEWLWLVETLLISSSALAILACLLAALWPREKSALLTGIVATVLAGAHLAISFCVPGLDLGEDWGLAMSSPLLWLFIVGPSALALTALATVLVRRRRGALTSLR